MYPSYQRIIALRENSQHYFFERKKPKIKEVMYMEIDVNYINRSGNSLFVLKKFKYLVFQITVYCIIFEI